MEKKNVVYVVTGEPLIGIGGVNNTSFECIGDANVLVRDNVFWYVSNTAKEPSLEYEYRPIEHDVDELVNSLTCEERKFLVYECLVNDLELLEKLVNANLIGPRAFFGEQIRLASDDELRAIMSFIKYKMSFKYGFGNYFSFIVIIF